MHLAGGLTVETGEIHRLTKRNSTFLFWVLVLVCLAAWGDVAYAGNKHIVILKSDDMTATSRSVQGVKKMMGREHPEAEFHVLSVSHSPEEDSRVIDSIQVLSPPVIVTVGSSATRLARNSFPDTPIVFCAVKYPVLSGFVESLNQPGGNVTGASLNIPTDIQFSYFKRIVPDLTRLGVLYTANTSSLIPSAEKIAARQGLTLVPILVESNKDLPKAIDSLASTVQGIWSVADPNLFSSKSTRYILLNALRKRIPFMGFSRNVVESGALFALDFDYKAVGFQAGQIANKILAGARPDSINVTNADVLWFHYNENTAKHIDVTIPEELVAVAKEVYR